MRQMRKYNQPKGLAQLPVLVQDTLLTSRYFEIDDFPSQFTAGKNLFKIQGNQAMLQPGRDVLVEILDREGTPIYHEVIDYIEPDTQQRVVAVYIYPDTPGGFATVYIAGTAQRRPNGSVIPLGLREDINVRWSRRIVVRPNASNNSEIILTQIPRVHIQEKMKNYLVPEEGFADLHFEFSGSNMRFEKLGTSVASRDGLVSVQFEDRVVTDAPFFSQSMEGGQILFPEAQPDLQPNQQLKKQSGNFKFLSNASSIIYNPIITSVVSDTVAIVSPGPAALVETTVQQASRDTGMGNAQPPLATFGTIQVESFPATEFTCSFTDFNVPFTSASTNTVSLAKIAISNIEPETGQIRKIRTSMRSLGFTTFMPMNEQDLTAKELFTADDENGVQLDLGNFKEQKIIDEYWRLDIDNTLIPGNSVMHGNPVGGPFEGSTTNTANTWQFFNLSGSVALSNTYGMTHNNSVLINAMKLQWPAALLAAAAQQNEWLNFSDPRPPLHARVVWNIDQDVDDDGETNVMNMGGGVFVNAGNTYQLSFKIALAYDDDAGGTPPFDWHRKPKVEVALSGSCVDLPQNFDPLSGKTEVVLDAISSETINPSAVIQAPVVQQNSVLKQPYIFKQFAPSLKSDNIAKGNAATVPAAPVVATQSQANLTFQPNTSNAVEPQVFAYEFTPTLDGYLQLVFKHFGGIAYIQNVSIKALDLEGFTPNHTYVQFEVPTFQQDDVLDFKFDFIDNNGAIVTSFTTRSMAFTGSNQFIDNGQVTGNMMIGDGIMIEGVELG